MGQGGNKLVAGLIAALIALTILLVVVLFVINADSQNDQEYIANTAELRVLSQEIAKNATEAAGGTAEAFNQLRRSRDEFQQLWTNVTEGNPETGLPPSELAQQSGVQENWNTVRENADSILSTQDAVLGLHEVARTLNETIPQLQVEYDDIVQILLDNDAPAEQIALAQRQSLLAERIVRSVNNVLSGDEDAV
ncbi:MAG TPA: chemotaxis protein, partial [Marinobacter adhaerens]|nr:chemotaxis protein [Marinobacter adhaerens]